MTVRKQTRRRGGFALWVLMVGVIPLVSGCVTVAEFRKLERQVRDMQRGGPPGASGSRERVADLATQVDDLEAEIQRLNGRLEVSEHQVEEALKEARAARAAAAGGGTPPGSDDEGSESAPAAASDDAPAANSAEVAAYRTAYDAWRNGNSEVCIDRFRQFLQTYPASAHADDAAYWMADCYFKQGEYKTAILRFDDVVSRYPSGNKAADALYRQGEALLRLGPGYGKAASKAFERVLKEYPQSGRATEAKRQLDLLGAG